MKEKYIAPDLFFESFKLSQSIAAGCGGAGLELVTSLYQGLGLFMEPSRFDCSQNLTNENLREWGLEDFCIWQGDQNSKLFTS